uniref:Uncharacterized protein n=1 Tax=uncultured Vibrionales bacterium HF0010_22E23 TaxID=710999 RepID=E0XRI8_9GAMM|nr:hypothetical protein [uncultured Vibrionales bacterium HF0010_22E23]
MSEKWSNAPLCRKKHKKGVAKNCDLPIMPPHRHGAHCLTRKRTESIRRK